MNKTKRKSDDELEQIVKRAVSDAVDYIEKDIQPQRTRAQDYYDGKDTVGHEIGRSKVVATKCRDAVRMVKPSLIRVFMQSEKPVEFIPRGQEDVQIAEEQTKYANYLFNKQAGFRLLSDVFDDALRKKVGVAKVYRTEAKKSQIFKFEMSPEEFAFLGTDGIEILEHEVDEDGTHRGEAQQITEASEIKIESMPPEEFFVDPNARSIDDFYVCGHRREMRVADFVDMGFAFDDVKDLGSDEEPGEEESEQRRGYSTTDDEGADPSMRHVLYTEAYMRVDIEGSGAAQLYAFIMAGSKYKLLDHYPVDDVPFAIFEIDPEAHTFFGHSLVELIEHDQDAATAMLRGVLDNVALTNSPRMSYDENTVNQEDMMNGEVGGLTRVDGSPGDKIFPLIVPFAAGEVLSAVQYLDQVIDNKTGLSRASSGMDPDALRNATATAVDASVRASMAQPELMARNLGEGGLTRLFRLMLRLIKEEPPREEMMRLNGSFTPVQVDQFDPELDVIINVGIGTGDEAKKVMALESTLQTQLGLWAQYGPDNGLVTMTGIRNTLSDMLTSMGVYNADRYYNPMNPEREQELRQMAQQAAQGAQKGQVNPLVEAEQVKAQVAMRKAMQDAQMKAQKAQQDAALDVAKMRADDDLARDKMLLDGVLEAANLLGKYNIPVDLDAVRRLQEQN